MQTVEKDIVRNAILETKQRMMVGTWKRKADTSRGRNTPPSTWIRIVYAWRNPRTRDGYTGYWTG